MKTVISTEAAPAAIGPYSQAIATDAGRMIFCSGQIPLDPSSGELVSGTISEEADRVLVNLGALLTAAGASYADVVKTTVYLTDMGDYAAVNEVYGRYFGEAKPARAAVAVSGLPKGVRVEIEAIAVI